jgi:hypothetical protein
VQIREISLKELYEVYELVTTLYPISYDVFEDRIYEMKQNYTMLGVLSKKNYLHLQG